jgi:hypothetical protein
LFQSAYDVESHPLMQELDEPDFRRKAAASSVAWLTQLNHVCGADGVDQRLEVAEVLIRRVDRANRHGVPGDPFLKLVGRCRESRCRQRERGQSTQDRPDPYR